MFWNVRLTNLPFLLELRPELPKWRNWQTRYVQGVVGERSCGFKSHLRHKNLLLTGSFFYGILLVTSDQTKENRKMKDFLLKNRKYSLIVVLVIILFVLMTLFGRLTELARLSNQRDEIAQEIQVLQKTQVFLRTQNAYATSVKAVEDYAREEGRMSLSGDQVIIPVPPEGATPEPEIIVQPTPEEIANWKVWWALFFGE